MAKRILIVEDDLSTQRIYVEKLSSEGFEVITTPKGAEGVFYATEKKPDLILLDIMLPGKMNGFDVLEKLKASEDTKKIPVIILTNLDTEREVASEIGADDYIIKANSSLDEVVLKIKKIL